MVVQVPPQTKNNTGLPPYTTLEQRDFLAQYGKTMADLMSAMMRPAFTGTEDASCTPVSQVRLKRKPLGAQGFAAMALATGRNGRKPVEGQGKLAPLRGEFLVGEMASGKTMMALLFLLLADRNANGGAAAAHEAYRNDAFPAVVLVPVTLLEKFAREALDTIPGVKPVIVLAIRKGRKADQKPGQAEPDEDGDNLDEEDNAEAEIEASVDAEASLRAFDPTYHGGNLSAVGVMNRVARRIRFELHAWEQECQRITAAWQQEQQECHSAWKRACAEALVPWRQECSAQIEAWKEACQQAEQAGQDAPPRPMLPPRPSRPEQPDMLAEPVLPPKPKHLVILSQSVAKLGSAWKPVYALKPLMQKKAGGKFNFVLDEFGNPVLAPACPRCGQPLVKGYQTTRDNERQPIYMTELDLLAKKPKDRKRRWCLNPVRRWQPDQGKYGVVPCNEPLWQVIPALQPPKLTPVSERTEEERRRPLPLPGEVQTFRRLISAPSQAAWEASARDVQQRRRLHMAYEAAAWRWEQSSLNPHPPCVVSAPERRYPLAEYILEHYRGLFKTAVVDEVHQYSGSGTAQGYAAQALVDAGANALGMTGTLFGGYARALFHLLRRMSPEFRRRFGPRDLPRFVDMYGVRQKVYKERYNERGELVGAMSKRRAEPEPKDLPGISPLVLEFLLPMMATVELKDVWLNATPYTEEVCMVDLGPTIGPAYEQLQRSATNALRSLIARGDRRAVSAWFHGLLRYPNMPWRGMEIVHPSGSLVLGTAPKLPEEYITPKERALLRIARRERAEGRPVLLYAQSTNKHDIQPRLAWLLQEDDTCWMKGLPIFGSEGDPEDSELPPRPAHLPPVRVRILRSGSPGATKREAWLRKAVQEGIDVLICNSKLVEVGLDLLAFPTIIAYEIIYSTTSMRQAFRRSWRPGQTRDVRVYILCYEYGKGSTMESRGLGLIAVKAAISMMLEGKLPPAQSMSRQVMARAGGGDAMMELALAMVEANGEVGEMQIQGSIEETFRKMQEGAQVEVVTGVKDQLPPVEAALVEPLVVMSEAVAVTREPDHTQPHPVEAVSQPPAWATRLLEPAPAVVDARPLTLFDEPGADTPSVADHNVERREQPAASKATQQEQPSERAAKKRRKRHHKKHGKPTSAAAQAGAGGNEHFTHAPPPAATPAAPGQRATFGKPPERHHSRQSGSEGVGMSLWNELQVEVTLPKQNGLFAHEPDVAGADEGASSAPIQIPPAAPGRQTLDEMLQQIEEEIAAGSRQLEEDEKCAVCGALVEMYGPDGTPYCSEHAPEAMLAGGTDTRADPPVDILQFAPSAEDEGAAVEETSVAWLVSVSAQTPGEQIVQALQYLAGVCDGAALRDGHGFNRNDTVFGHDLARQSKAGSLTPRQLRRAATKLLPTYRRQLSEAGLTLPLLGDLERRLAEEAAQHATPVGTGTFRLDGDQVVVRFHRGDPEHVAAIKTLRARYHGSFQDKPARWLLPLEALDEILTHFPDLESVA